jgi:hypothetical protein
MAQLRQPRINYGPEHTLRDLNKLALTLALENVSDKKGVEKDRVNIAANRLASLERRRNQYEVAFLEKQAQISGYIGDAQNLSDIYQTESGSSIKNITADLYEEPFKYYQQAMDVTQKQIDLLNPQILESVDKLARLAQAEEFLTKGVGATYTTGTGEEVKTWGPEDLTQALFMEKFYPDIEAGKGPAEIGAYFKRHQVDPTFIAGKEKERKTEAFTEESRIATRAAEQRAIKSAEQSAASALRAQEIHEVTMGRAAVPLTTEINKSLERANWYNPQINKAGVGMTFASMGYAASLGKPGPEKELGQQTFEVEAFRIGLLFNPAARMTFGIAPDQKIKEISTEQLMDMYQGFMDKAGPKRQRALEVRRIGEKIFFENSPERAYDPNDIKKGMKVPPYNVRDELIATAYARYRDYANISSTEADKYAEDAKWILGIDLKYEGTLRPKLKEFFRVNALEGVIGVPGGYEEFNMDELTSRQKDAAYDLMEMIKNKYHYDIAEDKWIDSIDKDGNITYE